MQMLRKSSGYKRIFLKQDQNGPCNKNVFNTPTAIGHNSKINLITKMQDH